MTIDEALDRVLPSDPGDRKRLEIYQTPDVYTARGEGPWTACAGNIIGRGNTPTEAVEAALASQAKVAAGDWSA